MDPPCPILILWSMWMNSFNKNKAIRDGGSISFNGSSWNYITISFETIDILNNKKIVKIYKDESGAESGVWCPRSSVWKFGTIRTFGTFWFSDGMSKFLFDQTNHNNGDLFPRFVKKRYIVGEIQTWFCFKFRIFVTMNYKNEMDLPYWF